MNIDLGNGDCNGNSNNIKRNNEICSCNLDKNIFQLESNENLYVNASNKKRKQLRGYKNKLNNIRYDVLLKKYIEKDISNVKDNTSTIITTNVNNCKELDIFMKTITETILLKIVNEDVCYDMYNAKYMENHIVEIYKKEKVISKGWIYNKSKIIDKLIYRLEPIENITHRIILKKVE
jgi:hypothetical protein